MLLGSCFSGVEDPGCFLDYKVVVGDEENEEKEVNQWSSSSSSSIGEDSDTCENLMEKRTEDVEEVQSSYKGPLDAMEALEEVLPIRRGISRFYNGKSKSFTSLSDASSASSIKDVAKPDNAYVRKRRNLVACELISDKNKNPLSISNIGGGGISKRKLATSAKTTLALAAAIGCTGCCKNEYDDPKPKMILRHSPLRPQLMSPRRICSSLRSFSTADLQHCVSVAAAISNPRPSGLEIKPT